MRAIDLNSDLGEGYGHWSMADDDAMLRIVSSANIACGAHAGDAHIMRRRAETAVELGVRIGAHVAYRDMPGFGRRVLDWSAREVEDETLHQLGALQAAALAAGDRVRYVKPHGALYHQASAHHEVAFAIANAIASIDPRLSLVGPAESEIEYAAHAARLPFAAEGFADRRYNGPRTLVDRRQRGAVLGGVEAINQVLAIARGESIGRRDRYSRFTVRADTICVHGDTPGSVQMARDIRRCLAADGIEIRPFA